MANEKPQRSTMGRNLLRIEHPQTVPREDLLNREQRQIGEMLVIDRIELQSADQVEHVRKLDGEYAFVTQENLHARDKIVDVGYVREHVLGRQQVGAMP